MIIKETAGFPHPGSRLPGEKEDIFYVNENIVVSAVVCNGGTKEADNYHGFEDNPDYFVEVSRRSATEQEIADYENNKKQLQEKSKAQSEKESAFEIACDDAGVNPDDLHEIISWEGECNEGYPAERWREKVAKRYSTTVEVINNLIKMWRS